MTRNTRKPRYNDSMKPKVEPHMSTTEAAEILGLHPGSIRDWCVKGKIRAWQTPGARGKWRIPVSAVEEAANTK